MATFTHRCSAWSLPLLLFPLALTTFSLFWFLSLVDAGEITAGWQAEWERTLREAKKEGQVTVYMWGPTNEDAVVRAGVFQRAQPGIKVFGVSGLGGQVEKRIVAERRAGKFLADVVITGANSAWNTLYRAKALDPIKHALIVPEVVDESKWWGGKHRYVDPEGQYIFVAVGTASSGGFSYNATLIKNPAEFKSYWDFLNPKWKGKMAVYDVRGNPGRGRASSTFFYYHPEMGPNFIRRIFAEMDPTLFKDDRLGTDWLAKGRFPLCFACDARAAKLQGLPVDDFGPMKEGQGLSPQAGVFVLINRAPHPNAAKVFINWFLSREGQITYQSASSPPGGSSTNSLREDIPKDVILPDRRRVKGIYYLPLDRSDMLDMEPIYKAINEGLAQAGKR